jgi:hypothetical protein
MCLHQLNILFIAGVVAGNDEEEEILAYYSSQSIAATTLRPKSSTAKSGTTAKPSRPTSAKPAINSQARPEPSGGGGYEAPAVDGGSDEEPVGPRPGDQSYLAPADAAGGASGSGAASAATQQVLYCTYIFC